MSNQSVLSPPSMRQAYRVLGVTTLGLMFIIINASSVNVALPSMSRSFDVDANTANWFLVAFMLANTASILVFGRISDMVGRRRIYLIGIAAFVVFSVLAAFAPSAEVMIALRVLQGIAAATTVSNTGALLADSFPPERLGYGLSLNLTAAAVATSLGPTIGGALVTGFGWQAVFLVNVPFGIAAVVLGLIYLPRSKRRALDEGQERARFDYAGAVISSLGLVLLLYGINRIAAEGIGNATVLGSIALGVVLLVVFVVIELRVRHPLVDLALVRTLSRGCAYAAVFFNSFARAGVVVLVVLHQQVVYGRSAFEAGIVIMAMALAMMVSAPISGRLLGVVTARTMSACGGLLLVVGIVGLMLTTGSHALPEIIVWLVLVGLGLGLFTTPNSTAIMIGIPVTRRATANAIRAMLFNSAQTMGTAIALLIVTASGVSSYATAVSDPRIQAGFQLGYGILALSAVVAMILSIARGGAWVVKRLSEREEVVVPDEG